MFRRFYTILVIVVIVKLVYVEPNYGRRGQGGHRGHGGGGHNRGWGHNNFGRFPQRHQNIQVYKHPHVTTGVVQGNPVGVFPTGHWVGSNSQFYPWGINTNQQLQPPQILTVEPSTTTKTFASSSTSQSPKRPQTYKPRSTTIDPSILEEVFVDESGPISNPSSGTEINSGLTTRTTPDAHKEENDNEEEEYNNNSYDYDDYISDDDNNDSAVDVEQEGKNSENEKNSDDDKEITDVDIVDLIDVRRGGFR